jgi:polygalacturonase
MTITARDATLALLASRSADATICPSEVARAIAPGDGWRDAMSAVHSAVDRLFDEGTVRLSWKGKRLVARTGPYRISRASHG